MMQIIDRVLSTPIVVLAYLPILILYILEYFAIAACVFMAKRCIEDLIDKNIIFAEDTNEHRVPTRRSCRNVNRDNPSTDSAAKDAPTNAQLGFQEG